MPRASRVCLDCPTVITSGSRCPLHQAQRDRARGSRHERGYDSRYVAAREQALAGATHCATCHRPFTAENPATGGHVVAVRDGGSTADGIKPECRACNYGWRRTGS